MKYTIVRSRRKTISLQIDEQLNILIRAPYYMPERDINRYVEEKSDWIKKHTEIIRERQLAQLVEPAEKLTSQELDMLSGKAAELIPKRVAYFAGLLQVGYGRITIRRQHTRWGSCSSKGNLNFNCLLMLTPPEVIDYVVVHELCHRLEMNHSKSFWQLVESILPDYRVRRRWLKEKGNAIIRRLP